MLRKSPATDENCEGIDTDDAIEIEIAGDDRLPREFGFCRARHAHASAPSESEFAAASADGSQVTAEGEKRPLTAGEIEMCQMIFKDAIDYRLVYVHKGEYFPFGLQDDDTAMTPNGEIYFNPKHFLEDFSCAAGSLQVWFVHEMVHVWQHQMGYAVKWHGMQRWNLDYNYTLDPGKRLGSYNMEAQGNIVADYFALTVLNSPAFVRETQHALDIALFETVLSEFRSNPRNEANLPGG